MSSSGFGRGQGQGYSPLDSNSGTPFESPGTYSHPFFASSGVGNVSSGVRNASGVGVGSASYPGIELQGRHPAPHRHSAASLYSLTNLPPPPPGPPPLPSINARPISSHQVTVQSSYSNVSRPPRPTGTHQDSIESSYSNVSRPPPPPRESRESVHFADSPPRPGAERRESRQTYSTAGTLFPSPGTSKSDGSSGRIELTRLLDSDEQPFLLDPINKVDTFYTLEHVPYEDHTGRQLRHILIGSSLRLFITFALCGAYILATVMWQQRGVLGEGRKRMYNAITTAISIALGLNLMSAFKDLALNMRWPVLSAKRRNLIELDLILRADSLIQLTKLAFLSRRPIVIISTILWLLLNIAAQGGIAMLNLTYGFESDTGAVLLTGKVVSVRNMEHFWPQGNNSNPTLQDEEYMAHLYGGLAYNYGLNETKYMPKAGELARNTDPLLWFNVAERYAQLRFSESAPFVPGGSIPPSVYTNRTIQVDYDCVANQVTAGGDGTTHQITVANVGNLNISHTRPDSITFFTEKDNLCANDQRCSIVQAFEASKTRPWYYNCTVKVGQTVNDPDKRSQISDQMAYVAGSSIAQMGYADENGQEAQYYPANSLWGIPLNGDTVVMGQTVATFALGSIAGASIFNPTTTFEGNAPKDGFKLEVRHPNFFYLIIGLLCGCQLLFCVVVAVLANRVMVGPDSHLAMALLLRPIADALEGVSNGKVNSAFRDAKKNTMVRYEKARNGRWILNMKF